MAGLRKLQIERDLLIIDVLTLFLILTTSLFPVTWLLIILGLPFLLFFPGYMLIAALFPRREGLDSIERLTLSFGLSIAIVPLFGLVLNYTPWGIKLYPILLSVSFFILAMSAVAWYKRRRYLPGDRFSVAFLYRLRLPGLKWQEMAGWDKVLSIALVISILGAIGTLAYVIATPQVGEKFTEFYILGPQGQAANYPDELVVGEEGNVILGIVNREQQTMSYRVEVWVIKGEEEDQVNIWLDDDELAEIEVELAHEETWENAIGFVLNESSGSTILSVKAVQGDKTLLVAGTDNFDAGDIILIGSADKETQEFVQIEDIDVAKSEITIKTALLNDHSKGEAVIEKQKLEFRLFKDGDSQHPQTLDLNVTVTPA